MEFVACETLSLMYEAASWKFVVVLHSQKLIFLQMSLNWFALENLTISIRNPILFKLMPVRNAGKT